MNDEHNWSIFYRFDGDLPTEFYEVRRYATKVWTAKGKARTWGKYFLVDAGSEDAALAAYREECQKAQREGFYLTRSGRWDPQKFDSAQLALEIYEGAKRAFEEMRHANAGQTLSSFALLSDDSAMSLVAAANSIEALNEVDHDEDCRWNVAKWQINDGDAHLDIAYRMILPPHRGIPCEIDHVELKDTIFDACVQALRRLRDEGFFGPPSDDVVVLFQVHDSDSGVERNKQLNTAAVYQRYTDWIGT